MLSAKQAVDTSQVGNVFILKPGAVFTNRGDSVYFVLPRYRLERLLTRAALADSIPLLWERDRAKLLGELDREAAAVSFWRTITFSAGLVAFVELLVLILK